MNKDVCMFCGGNLTMLKEYYVCESVKQFRSEVESQMANQEQNS